MKILLSAAYTPAPRPFRAASLPSRYPSTMMPSFRSKNIRVVSVSPMHCSSNTISTLSTSWSLRVQDEEEARYRMPYVAAAAESDHSARS